MVRWLQIPLEGAMNLDGYNTPWPNVAFFKVVKDDGESFHGFSKILHSMANLSWSEAMGKVSFYNSQIKFQRFPLL